MENKNIKNKLLTVLLVIASSLFILSFAIIIPCFIRGFYINQIDQIGALEETNFITETYYGTTITKQDIIDAFNAVMDFIWKGKPFPVDPVNEDSVLTGILPLSTSAAAHFKDCIFLFWLDMIVFIVTVLILITLLVLYILKKWKPVKIFRMSPLFLAGLIVLTLLVAILILGVSVGFEKLFELFHVVMFPGKQNWLFDYRYDVIINCLTEDFFFNCAVFIGSFAIGLSLIAICYSIILRIIEHKKKKAAN